MFVNNFRVLLSFNFNFLLMSCVLHSKQCHKRSVSSPAADMTFAWSGDWTICKILLVCPVRSAFLLMLGYCHIVN